MTQRTLEGLLGLFLSLDAGYTSMSICEESLELSLMTVHTSYGMRSSAQKPSAGEQRPSSLGPD